MKSDWQPIETAPRDGTRLLARRRYQPPGGGYTTHEWVVWWAQNTAVADPWITHFWADAVDACGPVQCYHAPDEWQPLEGEGTGE